MKQNLLVAMTIVIGMTMPLMAADKADAEIRQEKEARDYEARFDLHGRPAPTDCVEMKSEAPRRLKKILKFANASSNSILSYPDSVGGNKSYEYISSFTVTPKDGYYKITVKVICPKLYDAADYPGYGSTLEYVNVWIDWNGDYSWSDSERVMAKSSANYKKILADNKILYFETTVKDASTASGTFKARAMLGYGYDPTNPATYSWTWGDVMDVGVTFKFEPPQLYSFRIKPSASVSVPGSSNIAQMEGSKSPTKDNMVLAGENAHIELYVKVRIADRNSPNFAYAVRVENMYFDDVIEKSGRLAQTPDEVDGEYGLYKVLNSLKGELMWYRGDNRIHEDAKYYGEQCLKVTVNCEGFDICQVPHYFPYYRYYPATWPVVLSAAEKAKYGANTVPMWFYMWREFFDELCDFKYDDYNLKYKSEAGLCKPNGSYSFSRIEGSKASITWNPQYFISSLAVNIEDVVTVSKKTGFKQSKVEFPIDSVVRTVKHEKMHGTLYKDNKTGTVRKKVDPTVTNEADCWYLEIDGDAEGKPVQENGKWKWQEGDMLTTSRENEIKSKNEKGMTDTHEIHLSGNTGWNDYESYGDQEYYVRWSVDSERASKYKHNGKKYTELDWSYPGAQTPAHVSGWGVDSKKSAKKLSVTLNVDDIFHSDVLSADEGAAVLNDNELFTGLGKPGISFLSFVDESENFESNGLVLGVDIKHELAGTWNFGAYLFGTNGVALAKAYTTAKIDANRSHISFVFSPDTVANIKDIYSGPFVLGRVECIVPQNSSANAKSAVNVLVTKDYSAYECKVSKPIVGSKMSDYADGEGLHVVIPVTVPNAGTYAISAYLASTNGMNLVTATTNCVCVEGKNSIDVCFPKDGVFNTKVSGRFLVRDVSVTPEGGEPSLFVCDYETNPYNYSTFDSGKRAIVILPDTIQLSVSKDEDPNALHKGIAMRFTVKNKSSSDYSLYRVSAILADANGYNVAYAEEDFILNGESSNVLFFPAQDIRASGKDGPYSVKSIRITDRVTGELIDGCAVSAAKTIALTSTDFKGALTIDEDAIAVTPVAASSDKSKYAGFHLVVPINSPSSGYATLSAIVESEGGALVGRFEDEIEVAPGDNKLTLKLAGAKFLESKVNGPYVIRAIAVSHSSNPDAVVEAGKVLQTGKYAYTQFVDDGMPDVAYYTVKFNKNASDATGTMAAQTFTRGVAQGLSRNAFTRRYYKFTGWATTPDGAVVYSDEQSIEVEADATLYAVWELDIRNLWPESGGSPASASFAQALAFTSYLLSSDVGEVVGTMTVKTQKERGGVATATVTIQTAGGKKQTIKGSISAANGTGQGALAGLTFTASGVTGTLSGYSVDGAIDASKSKDTTTVAVLNAFKGKSYVMALEPEAATGEKAAMVNGVAGFSIAFSMKGKAKVTGTMPDGTKVSVSSQLIVGSEWCCLPVVYSKAGSSLAFLLWFDRDGNFDSVSGMTTWKGKGFEVKWCDEVAVSKVGNLSGTSYFNLEERPTKLGEAPIVKRILPINVEVTPNGAKWNVPKPSSVKMDQSGTLVYGSNPSALKLTYKAKAGTFSGTVTFYAEAGGKLKKIRATVSGVVVDGVGYGTALVKKQGTWPVVIGPDKIEVTFETAGVVLPSNFVGEYTGFVEDSSKATGNPKWPMQRGTLTMSIGADSETQVIIVSILGKVSFSAKGWDYYSNAGGHADVVLIGNGGEQLTLSVQSDLAWYFPELVGSVVGGIFGATKMTIYGARNRFTDSWGTEVKDGVKAFLAKQMGSHRISVSSVNYGGGSPYNWEFGIANEGEDAPLTLTIDDEGTATVSGTLNGRKIEGVTRIIFWTAENYARANFYLQLDAKTECLLSFALYSNNEPRQNIGGEGWMRNIP